MTGIEVNGAGRVWGRWGRERACAASIVKKPRKSGQGQGMQPLTKLHGAPSTGIPAADRQAGLTSKLSRG